MWPSTQLGTLVAMLQRSNALVVLARGLTVLAFTACPKTLDEPPPPFGRVTIDAAGPFSP